jgi:hypothetical protein
LPRRRRQTFGTIDSEIGAYVYRVLRPELPSYTSVCAMMLDGMACAPMSFFRDFYTRTQAHGTCTYARVSVCMSHVTPMLPQSPCRMREWLSGTHKMLYMRVGHPDTRRGSRHPAQLAANRHGLGGVYEIRDEYVPRSDRPHFAATYTVRHVSVCTLSTWTWDVRHGPVKFSRFLARTTTQQVSSLVVVPATAKKLRLFWQRGLRPRHAC